MIDKLDTDSHEEAEEELKTLELIENEVFLTHNDIEIEGVSSEQ